ncbi:MAG: porphobilinogen synthase [Paracoccaceae bacterium]|nr:porphobilinogen synthase [Paracoccaceae bacterium]
MRIVQPDFPTNRPRRLRRTSWMRRLVRESALSVDDLIWPLFLVEGEEVSEAITTMPGIRRLSVDRAVEAAAAAARHQIPAITLFPHVDPKLKTIDCREAVNPDNLVNRATRAIKASVPEIGVMLDVALDPFNALGHDGIVRDGEILNDETLDVLRQQALVQADAGADILGPSDMMDGRVGVIREALESAGHHHTAIMAYTAKYASVFYGPFRDAVGSAGALSGDKKSYQMDSGNSDEALRMAVRDLAEGADMIMVKPGMAYLDICATLKAGILAPVFAYQVSGEYAMIAAAADNGVFDREAAILESLTAFKRAGCDGILTYFALEAARILGTERHR